jgi:putative tricarboxylic transport membrane protein
MGKADQFSSVFWMILGLAVVYGSNRLGLGTLTHPGPGFLSFWCGIFLAALSVPVFIKGAKMRRAGDEAKFEKQWSEVHWSKSVYVVLATLAYALAFTYLGFVLSTTLLLLFLFKAIEPEKWTIALGSAILASIISFIIFGLWLDVQLPRGLVERLVF